MTRRGFAVAGLLDHNLIQAIAVAAEQAGYDSFWANDTPTGDGLTALAAAAAVTSVINLGVGVIPIDRQPAEIILRRLKALNLPIDRLTIGIGSGGLHKGGLEQVQRAGEQLKSESEARVLVGALGPKMCHLAGRYTDGVLLNWLTPRQAGISRQIVEQSAAQNGRPQPTIAAYVRVAFGDAAQAKLGREANYYHRIPQYHRHFLNMQAEPIETTVKGNTSTQIQTGLTAFDHVLDETIVRAVTTQDTTEAYLDLLRAAAADSQP